MSPRKKAKRLPAKRGRKSAKKGVSTRQLIAVIQAQHDEINRLLDQIAESDEIDIPDLFELQLLMNHLSQLSEMSASIVASAHAAIESMARNIKA
jgi:uncharacterized protein DUF5407